MWLLLDIGNSAVKAGIFAPSSFQVAEGELDGSARGEPGVGAAEMDGRTIGEPVLGHAEQGAGENESRETGVPKNGALTFGTRETRRLVASLRFDKDAELGPQLEGLVSEWSISRVGGVSVVPSQSSKWDELCKQVCGQRVEFFNAFSPLPFELRYETPETLGNDRIAVAAGGWSRFGVLNRHGVIVVDAGTAINYEVITSTGIYLGGVIAPGPGLMRQALETGTAQLPTVGLVPPVSRIGNTTNAAMRSGIMFGVMDSVASMIDGIQHELGPHFEVVLTGGWGPWLSAQLQIHFESELVLKGVADLMSTSIG